MPGSSVDPMNHTIRRPKLLGFGRVGPYFSYRDPETSPGAIRSGYGISATTDHDPENRSLVSSLQDLTDEMTIPGLLSPSYATSQQLRSNHEDEPKIANMSGRPTVCIFDNLNHYDST